MTDRCASKRDERPRLLLPNTFQTPNLYIDKVYPLLGHQEQALLIYACRRIFGWQKTTDRISLSLFADDCTMSVDMAALYVANLTRFGILLRVAEHYAILFTNG